MFFNLLLLFTVVPALELALLIKVGTHIGVGNTLLLIILTGILGASLARLQGFSVLRNIQESLNRGEMPTEEMFSGIMILVGGIVLLTPGFITDIIGFMLLIPFTRDLIKFWLRHKIQRMTESGQIKTIHTSPRHNREGRKDDDGFEDAEYH